MNSIYEFNSFHHLGLNSVVYSLSFNGDGDIADARSRPSRPAVFYRNEKIKYRVEMLILLFFFVRLMPVNSVPFRALVIEIERSHSLNIFRFARSPMVSTRENYH